MIFSLATHHARCQELGQFVLFCLLSHNVQALEKNIQYVAVPHVKIRIAFIG